MSAALSCCLSARRRAAWPIPPALIGFSSFHPTKNGKVLGMALCQTGSPSCVGGRNRAWEPSAPEDASKVCLGVRARAPDSRESVKEAVPRSRTGQSSGWGAAVGGGVGKEQRRPWGPRVAGTKGHGHRWAGVCRQPQGCQLGLCHTGGAGGFRWKALSMLAELGGGPVRPARAREGRQGGASPHRALCAPAHPARTEGSEVHKETGAVGTQPQSEGYVPGSGIHLLLNGTGPG